MVGRFRRPGRLQIAAIVLGTVAVLFAISFAEKAVQAQQLLAWRSELQDEIARLDREKVNLQTELARRQQPEWYDEVLRDAGYVNEGDVRVVVVTQYVDAPQVDAQDPETGESAVPVAGNRGWFFNDHWRAWQSLLWGGGNGS